MQYNYQDLSTFRWLWNSSKTVPKCIKKKNMRGINLRGNGDSQRSCWCKLILMQYVSFCLQTLSEREWELRQSSQLTWSRTRLGHPSFTCNFHIHCLRFNFPRSIDDKIHLRRNGSWNWSQRASNKRLSWFEWVPMSVFFVTVRVDPDLSSVAYSEGCHFHYW